MATDLERLTVSLEASTVKFERAMARANGETTKRMQQIDRRIEQTAKKADVSFGAIGKSFATAFVSGAALRGAQQLIESNTRIENSLKVAGLAGDELRTVYDQLAASAKRNGASFEALATLYGRASLVQKELGVSSQDLTKFAENVAMALRVAGTDAQAASGSLMQLSQALGAGVVRAEEFNSILEGAPTIAQAAAAGITEAGGSVAKLRQLVIDGKVASDVFFRGFQAGAVILQDKAAAATFTMSQAMENLQTALIQTAGQFDRSTGVTATFADTLNRVALAIDRLDDSTIVAWLGKLDRATQSAWVGIGDLENSLKEIERIMSLADQAAGFLGDSFNGVAASAQDAIAASLGFNAAAEAPAEMQAKIEALTVSLVAGALDADGLRQALIDLGASPLNMSIQIADIMALAEAARGAGAAVAAIGGSGRSSSENISDQRSEQRTTRPINTVSITDTTTKLTGSGGSKGGGAKIDQYATAVANQEREIAALQRKTQLLAQLNPLVNDYGFALEKLNAQMELENAATQAGLQLTPERQAQIAQLAEGYAQATSEAARLAEAQDKVKESADALAAAGREALDSIIDGFLEGKDAGELFGNVLADLGKSLLKLGLNSLLDGIGGGGGILSSLLGGIGKREHGGPVSAGKPYIVGEKRPEIFVPNQSGVIVPRIPSMSPRGGSGSGGGGQVSVEVSVGVDDSGNLLPIVTRVAGQVAGQAVKANNKQLPGIMRDYNQRQG